MNDALDRIFTNVEVFEALKQVKPLKSLGLDGFGASFFQKHWHIVGNEVCDIVLKIFQGTGMTPGLNSTFITLILKCHNPQLVTEF